MSSTTNPRVQLIDGDGDAVTVTGTALDVNVVSAVADIDIGDVEILGHTYAPIL